MTRWQTPFPSKKDGWVEIPPWVIECGAIPHPRNKWTLRDGTVVEPGEWIVRNADGALAREAVT